MIAHLIRLKTLIIGRRLVAGFLSLSILCHVIALASGYLSKGALIQAMINYAKDQGHGTWTFPHEAEFFNLLQVGFVSAGLLIFVVSFFIYSGVLASLLVRGQK